MSAACVVVLGHCAVCRRPLDSAGRFCRRHACRVCGRRVLAGHRTCDACKAERNRVSCARYYSANRKDPHGMAAPMPDQAETDEIWRTWRDLEYIRLELLGPRGNLGSSLTGWSALVTLEDFDRMQRAS